MSDLLMHIENLRRWFPTGDGSIEVLRGVDFLLRPRERVAILGNSGVGKSTLLHIMGTLDHPSEGRVLFRGEDVFAKSPEEIAQLRNRHLGFIFQFHHLLPEFTALENVMMPALIRRVDREEAAKAATVLLDEVGLGRRLHHRPGELSGGEQQRVAVARALVVNPDVVLADEPTGNLDSHTGENIHDLLKDINRKKGVTFVIVTHNDKLAVRADRVLRMTDGTLTPQTMT